MTILNAELKQNGNIKNGGYVCVDVTTGWQKKFCGECDGTCYERISSCHLVSYLLLKELQNVLR